MPKDHKDLERESREAVQARAEHHKLPDTEEEARKILREKGIDDDVILSTGTTSTG